MTNNIDFTGKLTGLQLNTDQVTKAGKEWKAHKLRVVDSDGEVKTYAVSTKAAPAKFIEKLEVGQQVTVTVGGQFNSVVKVSAAGATAGRKPSFTPSAKPAFKDNTQGMIKGNAISNGVQLAIARHGKGATLAHVKEATLEIISLHLELEAQSLSDAVNTTAEEAPKAARTAKKTVEMPQADNDLDDEIDF